MSSLKELLRLPNNFEIPKKISPQNFESESFHPIIVLPEEYEVFDFSKGYDPNRNLQFPFLVSENTTNIDLLCMKESNFTTKNPNIKEPFTWGLISRHPLEHKFITL